MEEKTIVNDERIRETEKKVRLYGGEMGQRLIFIVLIAFMIVLPLGRIVSDRVGLSASMTAQQWIMAMMFVISMFLISIETINHRVAWNEYKLPIACLVIMWMFSFVVSFNAAIPKLAFWGNAYRGEGLIQIGGYYGLFVITMLLKEERYREWVIYSFLGIMSIFSILGIPQFLNVNMLGTFFPGMASFGFGNPNFFAAVAVIFAGIAMAGFWMYDEEQHFFHPFKWWNKYFWYLLMVISFIGGIAACSTVVYVGIIMLFVLFAFLEISFLKKHFIRIAIMLLTFLGVCFVLNVFSNGHVWGEMETTVQQIEEEGTIFGDSVGTNRMGIWKNVLNILPDFWLYGCGIEHLGYIYLFTFGLNEAGQMVDKAHNEYLDLWATRGIIPLILYLVFLFALFIPGIMQFKKENRYKSDAITMVAIFPFFAYIAQAFFNNSVIAASPYFWIICGLLVLRKKEKATENVDNSVAIQLNHDENSEIPEKNIEKI